MVLAVVKEALAHHPQEDMVRLPPERVGILPYRIEARRGGDVNWGK
jgi:hypothetical protein